MPLFFRIRESFRGFLRQLILYIFACAAMVAAFSGARFTDESIPVIAVVSLFFGLILGPICFFVISVLRFAFRR
ncbi:MAG TPA: hypothetical protein VFA13_05260 [Candidatus Acidoferrum sp.]|nr:hypothetical protein [Candidatus Acidoferrum sp.]